jgi:ribosomal protein L1
MFIVKSVFRSTLEKSCQVSNLRRFSTVNVSAAASENPTTPRHTTRKYGPLNIHDAVDVAKTKAWAKFDETVEITIVTGLDPRKPNQSVKGVSRLPAGTGKKVRICVIANPSDAKLALEAGADVAGGEEIIASIQGGDVNFNTIIASPELMPMIGKIGKVSLL